MLSGKGVRPTGGGQGFVQHLAGWTNAMKRKIFVIVSAILVGLFAAGGTASAAAAYPSPPPVSVTINVGGDVNGNIIIIIGSTIIFSGDGFDPFEGIGNDVFYSGPSGLRTTGALARLSAPTHLVAAGNPNGHFENEITLDQVGTATLVATGNDSGKSASLTVHVLAVGSTTAPGTTTVAGGGSNVAAGSDGSGLARTGASIAGPLAIGFVALFAGLALLFFGTRGVRQRKNARA